MLHQEPRRQHTIHPGLVVSKIPLSRYLKPFCPLDSLFQVFFFAILEYDTMTFQSTPNGGSSTCVIELRDRPRSPARPESVKHQKPESVRSTRSLTLSQLPDDSSKNDDPVDTLPSPTTATEKLQSWNNPRVNAYRTFSAFWSFFIMGANDAAYGALLPYVKPYHPYLHTFQLTSRRQSLKNTTA